MNKVILENTIRSKDAPENFPDVAQSRKLEQQDLGKGVQLVRAEDAPIVLPASSSTFITVFGVQVEIVSSSTETPNYAKIQNSLLPGVAGAEIRKQLLEIAFFAKNSGAFKEFIEGVSDEELLEAAHSYIFSSDSNSIADQLRDSPLAKNRQEEIFCQLLAAGRVSERDLIALFANRAAYDPLLTNLPYDQLTEKACQLVLNQAASDLAAGTREGDAKGVQLFKEISNNPLVDQRRLYGVLREYSKLCAIDRDKALNLFDILSGDAVGPVANQLIPEIESILKSFEERGDTSGLTESLKKLIPVIRHFDSNGAMVLAEMIRGFAGNGIVDTGLVVKVLSDLSNRMEINWERASLQEDVISRVVEKPSLASQEVLFGSSSALVDKIDSFLKIVTNKRVGQDERRKATEYIGELLTEANDPELDRKVAGTIFKANFDFGKNSEPALNPDDYLNDIPTRVHLLQQLGRSLVARFPGSESVQLQEGLQRYSGAKDVLSLYRMASSVYQFLEVRSFGE